MNEINRFKQCDYQKKEAKMLVKEKIDEKKERDIEKLKDDFVELQGTVSELRKRGKDTNIVDLMLYDIPTKITMAKATHEDKEIEDARRMIGRAKKEMNDVTGVSDFDRITQLIQEAFEHLRKDEKKQATENYSEIMAIYKVLTHELKKTVYSACNELKDRLSKP
jgi:hypothetical protein